jgi:hypothetical protein
MAPKVETKVVTPKNIKGEPPWRPAKPPAKK